MLTQHTAIERYVALCGLGTGTRTILGHLLSVYRGAEVVLQVRWDEQEEEQHGLLIVRDGIWSIVTLVPDAGRTLEVTRCFGRLANVEVEVEELWASRNGFGPTPRCVGLSLRHHGFPAELHVVLPGRGADSSLRAAIFAIHSVPDSSPGRSHG